MYYLSAWSSWWYARVPPTAASWDLLVKKILVYDPEHCENSNSVLALIGYAIPRFFILHYYTVIDGEFFCTPQNGGL